MGDGIRIDWPATIRDAVTFRLDRVSWPVRRYLCDRLVGDHAYSRNVAGVTFQYAPRPLSFSRVHPTWDDYLAEAGLGGTRNPGETA